MSAVLRKKIDSGAGVPPSILQMQGFWAPLFLKLLSEQPTVALWQKLANGLTGHDVLAREDPQSEAAATAGGLAAASRYLEVELALTLDGQASLVKCLFEVDYFQTYARNDVRQTADRKAQACSQSPKSLSDSVKASAISLDAVLDRMTLTIGECSRLEVGDVLPLANADAGRLSLCAETIHGSVDIGTGELGVWKRQRAVKLHTPVSESFARAIR